MRAKSNFSISNLYLIRIRKVRLK